VRELNTKVDSPHFRAVFSGDSALFDPRSLRELAQATMPFGKHAGRYLVDLDEGYILWCFKEEVASGQLLEQLKAVYEIKLNGLEFLIRKFR